MVQDDLLRTTFQILGYAELMAAYSQATRIANLFGLSQDVQAAKAAAAAAVVTVAAAKTAQATAAADLAAATGAVARSTALKALAVAEDAAALGAVELAAATLAAEAAMTGFLILIGAIVTAVLILTGAVTLLVSSLKAFSEESNKLFQTGVVLKNLGNSLQLPQVQAVADQTSRATGISRPEIEDTAGRLARTGIGGGQIESTLKVIGDSARGAGVSFTAMGEAIENGILGKMRGLKEFGITLQDTGSRAANLALIQQQLNLRFEGAAAAFRETLPGAIDAFQSSLQRFLSALGEQFAPSAIRVFNALANILDFLADHAQALADVITGMVSGPIGVILNHMAQAADAGKNPMAAIGHGGDPASERTLKEVADNTKMMADAVESQILGGSGEVVKQAFGYLQSRITLHI
jgi:hypothetical protein